ncbi:hypothetical protein CPB85DRAFT_1438529 [Mucidula mucida]|nr:hypothetical protein CPB85DRAFT_1438529 [Mucidula mucida]
MLAAIVRRTGRRCLMGRVFSSDVASGSEESNILHVRGIPKHATSDEVLASPAFQNLKGIVSARKAFRNNLSHDFLFLEFESVAAATAALMEHQQNSLSLDGEPLSVDYSRPHVKQIRPASLPTDTLFIGSIPFVPPSSTHPLNILLRAWTSSYGPIRRLSLIPSSSPTKPGFAHVQFLNFADSRRLYQSAQMHGTTLELVPAPSDPTHLPANRQRFERNKLILHLPSSFDPRSQHRLFIDYQAAAQKPRERDLTPNRRLVFRNWHESMDALTQALPQDGSVLYAKSLKVPGTGYIVMRSTQDARRLVEGGRRDVEVEYSRNVLPDGKGAREEEWEPIEVGVVKRIRQKKMMARAEDEGRVEAAMAELGEGRLPELGESDDSSRI